MRGHLTQRSKGSWTAVLSLGRDPLTGKYKQRWVTWHCNQKTAEKRLTALLHDNDINGYHEPTKITTEQYFTQWLGKIKHSLTHRSFIDYKSAVKSLTKAYGNVPLAKLTGSHIEGIYHEMLDRDVTPAHIRNVNIVLKKALRSAMGKEITHNPVDDIISLPRVSKRDMKTWSVEEVEQFLHNNEHNPKYGLYVTALHTGMRSSELFVLRCKEVDLIGHQLSVKRGKSKTSSRNIDLTGFNVAVLRKLMTGKKPDDFVFVQPNGRPYYGNLLRSQWQRDTTGVSPIRPHDMRHTHATLLLKQGVNPKIVQERLGHASIKTTMDVYSHVLPGMQKDAAKKFNDLFANS
jgi:integrase